MDGLPQDSSRKRTSDSPLVRLRRRKMTLTNIAKSGFAGAAALSALAATTLDVQAQQHHSQKKSGPAVPGKKAEKIQQALPAGMREKLPREYIARLEKAKDARSFAAEVDSEAIANLPHEDKLQMLDYFNGHAYGKDQYVNEGLMYILRKMPVAADSASLAVRIIGNINDEGTNASQANRLIEYIAESDYGKQNPGIVVGAYKKMAGALPKSSFLRTLSFSMQGPDKATLDIIVKEMYPPLSLAQIEAVYKKSHNEDAFINSDFWGHLTPGEKEIFLRAHLKPPPAQGGYVDIGFRQLLGAVMHRSDFFINEIKQVYRELMLPIVQAHPNEYLHNFYNHGTIHDYDVEFVRMALTDPKTIPEVKQHVFNQAHFGMHYPDRVKSELMQLLPPEEVLLLQQTKPKITMVPVYQESTIHSDPSLAHVREITTDLLPKEIQSLSQVEIAQWQVMIARNLYFRGEKLTPQAITSEAQRIQEFRDLFWNYRLFGNTIFAAHEEMLKSGNGPRFGRPKMITAVEKVARSSNFSFDFISPHIDRKANNFHATAASLEKASQDILRGIVRSASPLTFFADMHGGGKGAGAIYLSDGQVEGTILDKDKKSGPNDPKQVVETERTRKITAEQLAQAFIDRYKDPEKRRAAERTPDIIILGACSSANIVLKVAEILRDAKVPIPILIAMSEFSQYGFSHYWSEYGSNFNEGTIIQRYDGDVTPTMGGVFNYTLKQSDSKPIVIVPDSKGNFMQVSDAKWFSDTGTRLG